MEISVARALVELKTLGNRIEKAIAGFAPVDVVINNKLKSGKARDEFINLAKATAQSVNDLINYRDKLKSAIVKSNAETLVTINKTTMTVAQAIEKKTSVAFSKMYLGKMRLEASRVRNDMDYHNQAAQTRLDKLLEAASAKDKTDVESIAKPFMARNEATLVDALDIDKIIMALEEEIVNFESEVDIILSESNARTLINV